MNDIATWQQMNNDYLSTLLAWIESQLWLAQARQTQDASAINGANETLMHISARITPFEQLTPPPALISLSRILGLNRFEYEVLSLCVASELAGRFGDLFAQLHGTPSMPFPSVGLAITLFETGAWDVFSPTRPLLEWSLVEMSLLPLMTLTASRLRIAPRILHYVKGLTYLDEHLAPLFIPFEITTEKFALSASQLALVEAVVEYVDVTTETHPFAVIHLIGSNELSKQSIALAACSQLGLKIFRLPFQLIPDQVAEVDFLVRLWQRESVLLPIAVYIDLQGIDLAASGSDRLVILNKFLLSRFGTLFVSGDSPNSLVKPTHFVAEVNKPTPTEQRIFWETLLHSQGEDIVRLVSQFNLEMPTILQVVNTHRAKLAERKADVSLSDWSLWDACLEVTQLPPSSLAQRIDAKATWDDIVLPESERRLLTQLTAQAVYRNTVYDDWGFRRKMNRGLGISALFAGDSGTGKTMAAEVIANALHLFLYRIDLSSVVSKYIGETEKNLRQLFDAAEDSACILFFDEADALFGKRSEVKDSHDRYANIETNYLLQRLENFRGLVILATNKKANMDDAFLRRFRFVVNFPLPGVAERKLIWQRAFPENAPLAVLDYDRLASLVLTGGSIHSIAVSAAFLAASNQVMIGMGEVLNAAHNELRKLDRLTDSLEAMLGISSRRP